MKTPRSEPEYICDTSRMRPMPPHSRLHWLFALLLMTAVAGALWQHGHAGLTIGLLAAVPFFAASVYLPYRWVNSLARAIFNCLVFCGAVGWIVWRIKDGFPDLILVEGLCIASLIFMDGGRPKDYFYLFFISVFLLIYGSLVPRMVHLYLTGGAIVLLLILAFSSRTSALAGKPPVREIPSRWSRLWHPAVLQLILSSVLFWYIFAMMPLKNNDAPGLFETSFLTTRETALPPELSQWLRPKKYQLRNHAPVVVTGEKPQNPTAAGEKGTPANLPDPVSKSIIDGSGSSSQGQDLVFHVKSDIKLYHLARLYDQYDGSQWKASPRLERVRIRDYAVKAKVRSHLVEQKYSLVKMLSLRLYSGFRMSSLLSDSGNFMFAGKNFKTTFYGAELLKSPSELPFDYKVSVQMLIPLSPPETHTAEVAAPPPPPEPKKKTRSKKKKVKPVRKPLPPDPAWTENISRQYYLTLPRKKISKRVMELASRLTAGNLTAYGKALALRDYLRNTYPYRLEAKPVPPGKEPADYFLFELKEGHCEYFACALAVLARAAGLPSRVAVGFSPGNYNTLSNMFEVYEYHAHAWTQIYIEHLGWLTMDATPPSAIPSRTLPAGLGQLRDPFDDEWRITPPELTEKTQQFLKADLLAIYNKKDELSKIDSTLVEVVKAQEEITEKVKNKYEGTVKKIRKSRQSGTLFRLKQFWDRFANYFQSTFSSLYDFLFSTWPVFLTALLLFFFGFRFFRLCFIRRRWRSKAVRIRELRKTAEECSRTDPRQAVLDIYTALRFSLELTGQERGTLELLDFADRLAAVNRNLSESARVIFLLYYKAEYSSLALTPADAARAIALYDSIRYEEE